MRRFQLFISFLLLAVLLLGCEKETIPEKGDFSVSLPEGYSLSNVTDKTCDILRSDGTLVGGMVLTEISPKDMKRDCDSPAVARYLDSVAGLENMSEYFSWLGEEPDYPTQYMDHYITDLETQEKTSYKRVIFVRDGGVYDLWFDLQVMDKEDVPNFYSIVKNQGRTDLIDIGEEIWYNKQEGGGSNEAGKFQRYGVRLSEEENETGGISGNHG